MNRMHMKALGGAAIVALGLTASHAATARNSTLGRVDYPPSAMQRGAEGTARFRAVIGTDGLPESCMIVRSSGHADLDQATCNLVMAQGRFRPKRENGRAVASSYESSISWRLPRLSSN